MVTFRVTAAVLRLAAVCSLLARAAPALAGQGPRPVIAVEDPQGRAVVGAKVLLVCGDHAREFRTDGQGQVAVPHSSVGPGCRAVVSGAGFEDTDEEVGSGPWPRRIQFRLAPFREHVSVVASPGTARLVLRGVASARLTAEELRGVGNTTADWVRYAAAVAGTTGGVVTRVDGLGTDRLPPPGTISTITINDDPFSAEFQSPDENVLDIATRTPDGRFRWNLGGAALGAGGRNPLADGAASKSRGISLDMSGRMPGIPTAFVAQAAISRQDTPVPTVGRGPDAAADARVRSDARALTLMFLQGDDGDLRWRGSYHRSSSSSTGAGIGGLTLPEAAADTAFEREEARLTMAGKTRGIGYRAGIAFTSSATRSTSVALAPSIRVLGAFTGGSRPVSRDEDRTQSVTARLVTTLERSPGSIEVGGAVTDWRLGRDRRPNPLGTIVFPTFEAYRRSEQGEASGIRFVTIGTGVLSERLLDVAVFAQGYLVSRPRGFVRMGLRAGANSLDPVRWSPRVYASIERRGFVVSGGAGSFVRDWPADLFVNVRMRTSRHLREYVLPEASLAEAYAPLDATAAAAPRIVASFDDGLRRRSDVLGRVSIERRFGPWRPQLEYTFTDGRHLTGAERRPTSTGWTDALHARDRLRRHQLRARLSRRIGAQTITAHYDWDRSRDTGSGPFAVEPAGERPWARSADTPGWHARLVAALRLPHDVSASVIAAADGASRYDVTTTNDLSGFFLFTDRGGRARNSGSARGIRTLSLYAHRPLAFPAVVGQVIGVSKLDVGVHVENPFAWRNYIAYGSVLETPTYGRPLDALAGRTIRFWFSL